MPKTTYWYIEHAPVSMTHLDWPKALINGASSMIVLISRLNKQASEMRKGKLAPYIL